MGSLREQDLESLRRYLADTSVAPPRGLAARIEARISLEPPSTAPRRFRAAVRFGDVRTIWRSFWQNVATVRSPRARAMLRLQAMTTVGIALLVVSVGSAGALAAAGVVVTEIVEPVTRKAIPAGRPTAISLPAPSFRRSAALPIGGSESVQENGHDAVLPGVSRTGLTVDVPRPPDVLGRRWANPPPAAAKAQTPAKGKSAAAKAQTPAKGKSAAAKAQTPAKGKSAAAKAQTPAKGKSAAAKAQSPASGKSSAAKGKSESKSQAQEQANPTGDPQSPAKPQADAANKPKTHAKGKSESKPQTQGESGPHGKSNARPRK